MTRLISLLPVMFCAFSVIQAQETRQIMAEEFVKSRPGRSSGAPAVNRRTVYRRTNARPGKTESGSAPEMQLGLTIWRLRPSRATDQGARIIIQQESGTEELTPERVESGTPLAVGERIRFSFESPQPGYLYVIDREQYANGSLGAPYLIFPTTRTRAGDNRVSPGTIIEIPAQDDQPNYFSMRQSRPDQIGELLSIIIAPAPLEGITIGSKPLALSPEQTAIWEKQWGAKAEKFEMTGGAGKGWTRAEQEAGANATRQLTQEDPSPQTIYRVAAKQGGPFLVNVGVKYRMRKTR